MSVVQRQTAAMVLLVALPLGVSALTAAGLMRLDGTIENIAEEYGEVRMLEPIDRNLTVAEARLASGDPAAQIAAREALKEAEAGLVGYLATQSSSIAAAEHQQSESSGAAAVLGRLQAMRSSEGESRPLSERLDQVRQVHAGLATLYQAADDSVREAHRQARRARERTLWLVVAASLASTAACVGLIVWSTRDVNRRLRELHRRIAAHTPGASTQTARELGGVVSQIEDLNSIMLQKLEENGRELLRRERLVGIGLLAADVAHEINNPMNAILGLSELGLKSVERGAVDEPTRQELIESMRVMSREAVRCKAIVERLVAMVRTEAKPAWFDATALVAETVRVAQAARPDRASCFAAVRTGVSVRAFAPPNEVRQILLTLLINAADAVGSDGRIEADATNTGAEVWIRVSDNGRGFTDEVKQTFFRPFHTSREDGLGTGLGLSIAQALAEGMGAELRPFSAGPGRGSVFVLAIAAAGAER